MLSGNWIDETNKKGEFLNQKDYMIGGSKKAKKKIKRDFTDPNEEGMN